MLIKKLIYIFLSGLLVGLVLGMIINYIAI